MQNILKKICSVEHLKKRFVEEGGTGILIYPGQIVAFCIHVRLIDYCFPFQT